VERALVAASGAGERLLLQAPTGAGKTLIAYLAAALLAETRGTDFRGLVVVPSRPLLRQHLVDAGWLRQAVGLPIHVLTPNEPFRMWQAILNGPGLICTTPHSLRSRLERLGGFASLPPFDLAQFDEIDLFLTVDLEERQDIWPVLDDAIAAATPVVGYTGTSLSPGQIAEWENRGFVPWQPTIPEDWLPFTRVNFQGVRNQEVILRDLDISAKLSSAYRRYESVGGNPLSWYQIKVDARASGARGQEARAILTLHAERLKLFEGEGDSAGKLAALVDSLRNRTGLVLTRYIFSAVEAAATLNDAGIRAFQADGQMPPSEAERFARAFRDGGVPALVITRDLGGRGLDFPTADTALLLSPRSNYQTVAQELARIRSRRGQQKEVTVLYYEETTEALKAFRLASHLVRDNRYGSQALFEVTGVPDEVIPSDPFERAHVTLEESVPSEYAY
jgi:superfamily II DNA/RNA helicase